MFSVRSVWLTRLSSLGRIPKDEWDDSIAMAGRCHCVLKGSLEGIDERVMAEGEGRRDSERKMKQ